MEAAWGIPSRACAPLCLGNLRAPQAALRLNVWLSFLSLSTVPGELGVELQEGKEGGWRTNKEPELQALVCLEVGSEELARNSVLTWALPAFPGASWTPFPAFPIAPRLPGPLPLLINYEHAGVGRVLSLTRHFQSWTHQALPDHPNQNGVGASHGHLERLPSEF